MSHHKIILTPQQVEYILKESNISKNKKNQKLLTEVDWNFVADIVEIW